MRLDDSDLRVVTIGVRLDTSGSRVIIGRLDRSVLRVVIDSELEASDAKLDTSAGDPVASGAVLASVAALVMSFDTVVESLLTIVELVWSTQPHVGIGGVVHTGH